MFNVSYCSIFFTNCKINKKYLLDRANITDGTAVICAVPYFPKECTGKKNISVYAAVKDYHIFFKEFFEKMCAEFSVLYPTQKFVGFSDHSPIDERDAALRAGIGVLGENGLVITEKYSSFVFLGEFITDAKTDCTPVDIKNCIGCHKCSTACPSKNICLSELTQKKGVLTDEEKHLIANNNSVWGCDICQMVCPCTEKALSSQTIFTDIDYFKEEVIPELNSCILNALDTDSFQKRAFSWRGRNTVERNISVTETNHKKQSN